MRVVANGHPLTASSTDHESLQQCRTFPRRSTTTLGAPGKRVALHALPVQLILLPGNVGRMHVAQQDPLLAWHQAGAHLAIRQTALFSTAEDESASITRVVDNLPRSAMQQFGPNQFPFMRTAAQSAREQKFLRMELLDHRQTGSGPLKGFEEQTHRPPGSMASAARGTSAVRSTVSTVRSHPGIPSL